MRSTRSQRGNPAGFLLFRPGMLAGREGVQDVRRYRHDRRGAVTPPAADTSGLTGRYSLVAASLTRTYCFSFSRRAKQVDAVCPDINVAPRRQVASRMCSSVQASFIPEVLMLAEKLGDLRLDGLCQQGTGAIA